MLGEYKSSFRGTIKDKAANRMTAPSSVGTRSGWRGGLVVRIILVGVALAVTLTLYAAAAFQMAGDITPGGDAAVRVHRIAGDIVPGGS